jgi:molybdenum cofactor guanylyltransferase
MNSSTHRFAAALLVGGQSRRMGTDKAFLEWEGRPLWEVQLAKLCALQPAQLLVSCREEQGLRGACCQAESAESQGRLHAPEFVFDPPDNPGPLPALHACLQHTQVPLIVIAVDMPYVTVAFLQQIVSHSLQSGRGLVFKSANGYEPLCALYPVSVLPLLDHCLATQNFRLQDFVQQAVDQHLLEVLPLSLEQETFFLNLNSPHDLPCPPP